MYANHIRRPPVRRRSSFSVLACGCLSALVGLLVIAIIAFVVLMPTLPNLAAQLVGFTARGSTEALFQATPVPTIELQNSVQPPQFTVDLGQYGSQTLSNDSGLYDVQVGSDSSGGQAAVVSFSEAGLQELCRQRSDVCGPNNPRFRNAQIDLRPGGAVVYADVVIPQLGNVEQRAGAVLRLDASAQRFEFAGVDINGTIYDVPPEQFGETVVEMERAGNEILDQLRLEASGGQYTLSQVSIDDDQLTVLLR
jgi:hypothetical protein